MPGWSFCSCALFFFVRMAVGIWAGRQVQDNTDYVVAGEGCPSTWQLPRSWQPGLLLKHSWELPKQHMITVFQG